MDDFDKMTSDDADSTPGLATLATTPNWVAFLLGLMPTTWTTIRRTDGPNPAPRNPQQQTLWESRGAVLPKVDDVWISMGLIEKWRVVEVYESTVPTKNPSWHSSSKSEPAKIRVKLRCLEEHPKYLAERDVTVDTLRNNMRREDLYAAYVSRHTREE